MYETNIQNNSSLISLARAAQLTGYHQDYLGQLCRLGKLPAKKVGRNWFTYPEALNVLSAPNVATDTSDEAKTQGETTAQEMPGTSVDSAVGVIQPKMQQTVTISQVSGMPIAIRTVPHQVRNINTVQSILTSMRIESLQREVQELRSLLARLMSEVAAHTDILQNWKSLEPKPDSIKHSYISNFDFNYPGRAGSKVSLDELLSANNLTSGVQGRTQKSKAAIWPAKSRPRYALVTWVAAGSALAVVAFIGLGIAEGTFLGERPAVSTQYYRTNIARTSPQPAGQPAVAGANSDNFLPTDSSLPTAESGDSNPDMVQ